MSRQKRENSLEARSNATEAKTIKQKEATTPPITEGEVLQATHAAIYLAQRARALTKPDKREPLIACVEGLAITLQTHWNSAPLYQKKQQTYDLPQAVCVMYQANLVLDVRWNEGNRFVAFAFEPGPWVEILLRAAHPEQVRGNDRSSQLQDKE
ncbi:MAG: hypothetical protein AB7I36_17975 [Rhodospirillaceae bacterium]